MLVVFSLFLSFDIYVFSFFFYQVKGEMRRGGALPRTTRPLSSYHIGTQKLLCLSKEDFDSYTLTSNIFHQYRWSDSWRAVVVCLYYSFYFNHFERFL